MLTRDHTEGLLEKPSRPITKRDLIIAILTGLILRSPTLL